MKDVRAKQLYNPRGCVMARFNTQLVHGEPVNDNEHQGRESADL